MVYDELDLLQRLNHKHIVRFVDWFESRVCSPTISSLQFSLDPESLFEMVSLTIEGSRTNTTLSPSSV